MAKLSNPAPVEIDLKPSPEAREALELRTQASSLVVVNRETHTQALEFIRGAKQLKRKIEDHWSRITRNVDDLKKNLLNLKRDDLAPVEAAIATASQVALDYETAEKRRAQEAQDRERRESEARAQRERDAELARMEREALKAEEASKDLSERERTFVDYFTGPYTDAARAAQQAGYKDPDKRASILLTTPKIIAAIAAAREAKALRDQAHAKRAAPLDVVTKTITPALGKAAGVSSRTTYGCNPDIDLDLFRQAIVDGVIDWQAVQPNLVYLNQQAVQFKETFDAAFPGCRLLKKTGIAG